MNKQERSKIVSVILGRIQECGSLPLNQLYNVFVENGIDPGLYGGSPKRWMNDNFHEFSIKGSNGRETIQAPVLSKMQSILDQEFDSKDGKISIAAIPKLFKPQGIEYKEYTEGRKLTEWLPAVFPQFTVSDDNHWLLRNTITTPEPVAVPASVPTPSLEEVQQMHSMAFMNWWSSNIKRLKTFNEELTSESEVKAAVARQFANVILGIPGTLVDVSDETNPRIAFDTGLQSKLGEPIYCVLKINPKNVDGTKQEWALDDFACPNDDTPIGYWLKKYSRPRKTSRMPAFVLSEKASEVKQQRDALAFELEMYLSSLKRGVIPTEGLAEKCLTFENSYMELMNVYEQFWGNKYPEDLTIEQIVAQADEQNVMIGRIKNAVASFDEIMSQVQELFSHNKLSVDDTIQKDKTMVHRCCDVAGNQIDFENFHKILNAYRTLMHVMSAKELTPEIEDLIETELSTHFSEVSYRFAVRILVGADEDEWSFLREIDNIADTVQECQFLAYEGTDMQQNIAHIESITTEELLNIALQPQSGRTALIQSAKGICPSNRLERMLVFAEIEDALQYIKNEKDNWKYANDAKDALKSIESTDFPTELTCYGAASRLNRVIGSYDQVAEKYSLLGLACGDRRCVQPLLELYKEPGRETWFRNIFAHFLSEQANMQDQLYYLSVLCREFPDEALSFARKHYYLFYRKESLELLLSGSVAILTPEMKDKLQNRLHDITQVVEHNSLERAIVESNMEDVRAIVKDYSSMKAMGYTDEEIGRAINALANDEETNEISRDSYSIGMRLYNYQKNRHGLAEKYLWEGITANGPARGNQLLQLMTEEGRWDECCELYECFESAYSENIDSRQLYLISLLHYDTVKAHEYIWAKLQDCLLMISTMQSVQEAVRQFLESEDLVLKSFLKQVLSLSEFLEDPFIKSVICMDRMLREYSESAKAKELGLPDNIINTISITYKSDSYSHGMDAVSISERTFRFLGSYKGVSEAFARFALPDMRAVNQLWNIYSELGDEQQLFMLMQTYPQMQAGHKELYLKLLFQKEEYMRYIMECNSEVADLETELQLFIAKLKTIPNEAGPFPDVGHAEYDEKISEWFRKWGALLMSALIQNNRKADMQALLFTYFPRWCTDYTDETIRAIVTAEGVVNNQTLEDIQQDALLENQTELALYLYNVLHIGQLEEESNHYYKERMSYIETRSVDEQLLLCQQLRHIHGEKSNSLDTHIALLKVRQIKARSTMTFKEKAAAMGDVLEAFPVDSESLRSLLTMLEDAEVCYDRHIYTNLVYLAVISREEEMLVSFFNKMVQLADSPERNAFFSYVCRFYIKLFVNNRFPEDTVIMEDAGNLCMIYLKNNQSSDGILCLYFIERNLHQDHYADYLLKSLAEQSSDMISDELGEIISEQIKVTWEQGIPSFLNLFREILNDSSLEEIERYLEFTHLVSATDADNMMRGQTLVNEEEYRLLSEDDSNVILRRLFNNPKDASTWRQCVKLPLQENPAGYAKLRLIASRYNTDLWEECVAYCEKYEQFDLLLSALHGWIKNTKDATACRKHLEERLINQPEYFDVWKNESNKPELLEISKELCRKVNPTEYSSHATISAVSLIAVKTGFTEALDDMLEHFDSYLLGEECNLGIVVAVHLLLDRRFREAQKMLSLLVKADANMNYRELVLMLAGMETEDLVNWVSESENEAILRFVLPDGNVPSLEKIQKFMYKSIQEEKNKQGAEALRYVLTMFPDDYGVLNALFDLCCTKFDGYLPVLHQCLRGLIHIQPYEGSSYYRRGRSGRKQYAYMLAVLDALLIINKETDIIDDYDFTKDTGAYYKSVAASVSYAEASAVSEAHKNVLSFFENRNEDEIKRWSDAYLCCITGNWTEFIAKAWNNHYDIRDEINCTIEEVDDLGFARSVLKILEHIRKEDQVQFIEWIRNMVNRTDIERDKSQRQRQTDFVVEFFNEGYFENLEKYPEIKPLGGLLKHPYEDYSVYSLFAEDIEFAIEQNYKYLYELVFLIGSLVCYNEFQSVLSKIADELFEKGNDKQACALYHAMHRMNMLFLLVHTDYRSARQNHPRVVREQYETRYRITALFSNDKGIMEKAGSPDFHVWSCINMVLSLIDSSRMDEVYRLIPYLADSNAQIAEVILCGLDPSVDCSKKLDMVDELEDDLAKAYCYYVIKYPYIPLKKTYSYALSDVNVAYEMNERYMSLVKKLNEKGEYSFRNMSPSHILLLVNRTMEVDAVKFRQEAPVRWTSSGKSMVSIDREEPLTEKPFFIEDVEPVEGRVDVKQLIENHEKISENEEEYYKEKYNASKKILQHCLGMSASPQETTDAIMLYGVDYYYYYYNVLKDTKTANRAILVLARMLRQEQTAGLGSEAVEKAIRDTALHKLLSSYDTLHELLEVYSTYSRTFEFMLNYVRGDLQIRNCVNKIYSVLDSLQRSYSVNPDGETENLRKELVGSYQKLEEIGRNGWMDLKNRVQTLINDEINELDRRPVLQIEVLNQGIQRHYGYLFGLVRNIGRVDAENIVLRAEYTNNTHSNLYKLNKLAQGDKAVFEIYYGSKEGTEGLGYVLIGEYSYNGEIGRMPDYEGKMRFGEIEEPEYPTDLLIKRPSGIDFEADEAGNIYSPEFFGRKKETRDLRALVSGKDFASYRSAVVYGIKRTGKTSLLNYFAKYIEVHRSDNTLYVTVDCQSLPPVNRVQYVFIDHVIDVVERKMTEVKGSGDWDQLKQEWQSPNFCADQQPEKLHLFYIDLQELLSGKGLYLIIDEIDRLFELVEDSQTVNNRNLDSLFGAIATILTSSECRKAVHFVICGSNWLIRYNLRGDKANQLLQRFGIPIEVGKLPEADAKDVICSPYKSEEYKEQYQQAPVILGETAKLIWDYIGGLVWHTKLLAALAIERAKSDSRTVVYPSDVQQCLPKVLDEQWCKQFKEGYEDGGTEYQIIGVMQNRAAKKDSYVPIDQISKMLQREVVEVQETMEILKALKLVEQHPIYHQLYRFEQDIYRRYFRTQPFKLPFEYKRVLEEPDVFQDMQMLEYPVQSDSGAIHVSKNSFDDLLG